MPGGSDGEHSVQGQPCAGGLNAKNTSQVFFVLAAVTFLFGPARHLVNGPSSDMPDLPAEANELFSAGNTLWFWLAFLVAGAALFGAFQSMRKQVQPEQQTP